MGRPDPIFATLQREMAAEDALVRSEDTEEAVAKEPGKAHPNARSKALRAARLQQNANPARSGLLATVPTTPAGMHAYLNWIEGPRGMAKLSPSSEEVAALCATIRRALTGQRVRIAVRRENDGAFSAGGIDVEHDRQG